MKKFILVFTLWLISTPLPTPVILDIWLPEIVIEAPTYEREIFETALEFGSDSLFARILVAQALLESGNFTNNLTVNHNNIFSMQHPRQRETTSLCACATAENRPNIYASFSSVEDSVEDMFLYLKAKKINLKQRSIAKYVKLLKKKGYFEETEKKYIEGLRKKYKQVTVYESKP